STVFSLSGEASEDESDVITTFAIYDEDGNLITFSHHQIICTLNKLILTQLIRVIASLISIQN
ncbi:hypothetical protein, partial [Succinivibrio sp.]|uniref:hypothetical protein n=1 Tax=Succinivibrio sp. TaxID=2053619 RepID=UPI003867CBFB